MKRLSTHIEGLDEVLGGGIPEGNVVLVSGAPGTMKTSLTYHILHSSALNGSRGLYVSLEQGRASLIDHTEGLGYRLDDTHGNLSVLDLGTLQETDRIGGTTVAGPVQALHARHPQVVRLPLPRPRLAGCTRNPREVPRASTGDVLPHPLASGSQVHGVPPRRTADRPHGWCGSSSRRVREAQGGLSRGRDLAPPACATGRVRDAATVAGRQDAGHAARYWLPRARL